MATQYGVKAKKALGQHFLNDESVARRIVDSLIVNAEGQTQVLEIGPGTGVLTKYLLQNPNIKLEVAEIDTESIAYLQQTYPQLLYSLQQRDFLEIPLEKIFTGEFAVIGNFPYNISSQIFFKVLDYIETIPQVVCMLQREVAQRLASGPGSKAYGILSVLLQAWYDIEYLFTVDEGVFTPPPKVKSGVIRLRRNSRTDLGCSYLLFKALVKACFNQRRKTIRNSVKPILGKKLEDKRTGASVMVKQTITSPLLDLRPEQLSVEQFIELTQALTE